MMSNRPYRRPPGSVSRTPVMLVVDDEPQILNIFKIILRYEGIEVQTAETGQDARCMLEKHCPDLVVLDEMLPDTTGGEICQWLRGHYPYLPVIMCSAALRVNSPAYLKQIGANGIIMKPFDANEMVRTVHTFLSVRS
ncbi:MAG: response regulator [Anaerolineae bacterium]|nr:response regulator [Anaerolineae bacterium]